MEKPDTKTVAAKINQADYVALKMLGFKTGRPIAELAGEAIEEFLKREKQAAPVGPQA